MATENVDMIETSMTAQKLAGHLTGLLDRVIDGSFGKKHFEALAEGRDPFAQAKNSIAPDINNQVESWRNHFKVLYQINPDFSNLYIPERVPGFDRLIIVPKGLTHQKWVETARTIHEVNLYKENLDSAVIKNDRTPKDRSYGVWIRDRCEADEELKGKSADDLEQLKVQSITLLERLVGGTGYLFEKMSHVDRENVTLCSGSRHSDGDVPSVYWRTDNREVYVDWHSVSNSDPNLRTRAVVS